MKTKILLSLLLIAVFLFVSCKTDTEDERIAFDAKVTLKEAVTITNTPMMLGVSVYEHLSNKEELSLFNKALSPHLKGLLIGTAGPYTVFAPKNKGLSTTPLTTLNDTFLKKYIVKGVYTSANLVQLIRLHGGSYTLISIAGKKLTVKRAGMGIVIEDTDGAKAILQQTDFLAENGVVHTISTMFK